MQKSNSQLPYLVAALLGLCLGAAWPSTHADSLSLTIQNMPSAEGKLMIQVVRGEAGFNEEEPPVASMILPANGTSVTVTTNALAPGEYGVRIMQDVNNDNKMNSNMVGIPKEPWAFSNNATGKFGPPKWDQVKFTLDGSFEQTIDLVH